MHIPFPSLERRKGGGGGGGRSSGGGGGRSSGGGGKSSGGSSSGGKSSPGSTSRSPSTITSVSGSRSPYAFGSTKVSTIPAGQPFSGRSIGGGTRANIFGSRNYGSGYPGVRSASVVGRGFPFGFWPLTFGAAGLAAGSRFHSHEYGPPDNSSRPGGALYDAQFQSKDSNTYRILSDNTTVHSLIDTIASNCSLSATNIVAVPFNESDPSQPKPEQAIQYYRASSICLTLDGYNNSAVFSDDENASYTPLPQNLNTTFLECLNQTIGASSPLLDAAQRPQVPSLTLTWVAAFYIIHYLF